MAPLDRKPRRSQRHLKQGALHVRCGIVSNEEIIVSFIVSTVGFSVYLFGKKQRRVPQLITGILMMLSPLIIRHPIWATVTNVGLLIAMRVAISSGI